MMRNPRRRQVVILAVLMAWLGAGQARGQLSDEQVRRALARGVQYLKSQQQADGRWTDHTIFPGGVTALCTLALLSAGEDVRAAEVQQGLNYLRSLDPPRTVYAASLQTMALCAAEPERDAPLIRRNVDWLQATQVKSGDRQGAWGYSADSGSGDNSNTQFALLALHEAERAGFDVRRAVFAASYDYWRRTQREDGGWGYGGDLPPTGSMTCAGIASVIICAGQLQEGDAQVVGDRVQCCGEQADDDSVARGVKWLGDHFSVVRNPSPANLGGGNLLYYLYALERVGRMSGQRFLGRADWYREGAASLLKMFDETRGVWRGQGQGEDIPVIGTAFAVLFLSKGRRPVVVSKLAYGDGRDWDPHRQGVHHLTQRVERRWRRELAWQTIDFATAAVNDLLESPVLFLCGSQSFSFTPDQKRNLKVYVEQGGFLFAEAACGGVGFDRSFRALMHELFPDSPLRLLPADHPIWYAEQRVAADQLRPLWGVDACCRTSVVYCPQNLSCYWELSRGERKLDYPAVVGDEIEACLRIGANVLTYATGRELKNKLDRPQLAAARPPTAADPSVLIVPKVQHGGGGDDAPNALPNLLTFASAQTELRIAVENRLVQLTDPALFEYPILFMHGRREFRFSSAERQALAKFVERGGVLVADAICGNEPFAAAFRRELAAIFPEVAIKNLPPDHPLFTNSFRGYDVTTVTVRDPSAATAENPLRANLKRVPPALEALEIDQRLAVILSPYDLSCALENGTALACKGYVKEDAARLGVNILLYALQQ